MRRDEGVRVVDGIAADVAMEVVEIVVRRIWKKDLFIRSDRGDPPSRRSRKLTLLRRESSSWSEMLSIGLAWCLHELCRCVARRAQ